MKKIVLLGAAGLLTLSAFTATVIHQNKGKKVQKKHNCCMMKDKTACAKTMSTCPY